MNSRIALTIGLIMLALLASNCDARARQRRVTKGNSKSYDRRTHGSRLGYRSDQVVSTSAYREYVRSHVKCTGKYCKNGDWACDRSNWKDCYNVEHIIDANGAELRAYPRCKNVAANLIMAHSGWNQQLGSIASKNYNLSAIEKEAVYGSVMMELARASIRACQAQERAKRFAATDGRTPIDGRALDEDISFNMTQDVILLDVEGLWLIPVGANITCYDCNETWCYGECTCPECTYLEYTDQTASAIAIIVAFVVAIFAVGGVAGAGIAYGVARFRAMRATRIARRFHEMETPGREAAPEVEGAKA